MLWTWMSLGDIMLNEIIQTQKNDYSMIPLIGGAYNQQIHRDRKETRVYQVWKVGNEI